MHIYRVLIDFGPEGSTTGSAVTLNHRAEDPDYPSLDHEGARDAPAAEAWADLGDGWTAYFRLGLRPGLPVAEVRMFPSGAVTDGDDAWNGDAAEVPPQGVPVRKLRSIRLSDVREAVEHELRTGPDAFGERYQAAAGAMRTAFAPFVALLPDRDREPDPNLTTPQRLALVARDYVELVAAGDPYPNRTLAELWGRTPSQITTDVYNARHRYQLLKSAPRRGQAGGELTAKARKILERLDRKG